MRETQPYYDLDSPIYLFGVPTAFFLFELGTAIALIFIFKVSIIITLLCVLGFHFLVAFLYKWSPNWIEKILFYLSMPYTRVYKEDVSYVPSNFNLKEEK